MDNLPRWFLTVALTAILAALPMTIALEKRLTTVELVQKHNQENTAKDRKLFLEILTKMDKSVEKLADAVHLLQVDIVAVRNARKNEK